MVGCWIANLAGINLLSSVYTTQSSDSKTSMLRQCQSSLKLINSCQESIFFTNILALVIALIRMSVDPQLATDTNNWPLALTSNVALNALVAWAFQIAFDLPPLALSARCGYSLRCLGRLFLGRRLGLMTAGGGGGGAESYSSLDIATFAALLRYVTKGKCIC
jgi:hypothetical protein